MRTIQRICLALLICAAVASLLGRTVFSDAAWDAMETASRAATSLDDQIQPLRNQSWQEGATAAKLRKSLGDGTPADWIKAAQEAGRKQNDLVRALLLQERAALQQLAALPRGSAEAAAMQAKVKEIDHRLTEAARRLGAIKNEEERLRVFAAKLSKLEDEDKAISDRVQAAYNARQDEWHAVWPFYSKRDYLAAADCYTRSMGYLRTEQAEVTSLIETRKKIQALYQAEITARGGTPPLSSGGGTSSGTDTGSFVTAPPPQRPVPSANEIASAGQVTQLSVQFFEDKDAVDAQRQWNEQALERIRAAVEKKALRETIDLTRKETRDGYLEKIDPLRKSLEEKEQQLKTVDPDSSEAKALRSGIDVLKTQIQDQVESLKNQRKVFDQATKENEAGRDPIRQLQADERTAKANLAAARSELSDAQKAVADCYRAYTIARALNDKVTIQSRMDRYVAAFKALIAAQHRVKLREAELATILATQERVLRMRQTVNP